MNFLANSIFSSPTQLNPWMDNPLSTTGPLHLLLLCLLLLATWQTPSISQGLFQTSSVGLWPTSCSPLLHCCIVGYLIITFITWFVIYLSYICFFPFKPWAIWGLALGLPVPFSTSVKWGSFCLSCGAVVRNTCCVGFGMLNRAQKEEPWSHKARERQMGALNLVSQACTHPTQQWEMLEGQACA